MIWEKKGFGMDKSGKNVGNTGIVPHFAKMRR
jgi:hypothetical protein